MKGGFNDPKILIIIFICFYCCLILSYGAYTLLNSEEEEEAIIDTTCKDGTTNYKGKCKKIKSQKECINENNNKLFKPNKATKNTSCIKMSLFESEKYCMKIGMMYDSIDKKCITKIDDDYCKNVCKNDSTCDINFPLKADPTNSFCEKMSLRDVKKKCAELNRIYFSGKCLEKLERPNLSIENNKVKTFEFKGKIKSKQNILDIDSVLYKIIELDDSNGELNTKEEYANIISRSEPIEQNGDYVILFENSSPLKDSTNYKISKAKYKRYQVIHLRFLLQ